MGIKGLIEAIRDWQSPDKNGFTVSFQRLSLLLEILGCPMVMALKCLKGNLDDFWVFQFRLRLTVLPGIDDGVESEMIPKLNRDQGRFGLESVAGLVWNMHLFS